MGKLTNFLWVMASTAFRGEDPHPDPRAACAWHIFLPCLVEVVEAVDTVGTVGTRAAE